MQTRKVYAFDEQIAKSNKRIKDLTDERARLKREKAKLRDDSDSYLGDE